MILRIFISLIRFNYFLDALHPIDDNCLIVCHLFGVLGPSRVSLSGCSRRSHFVVNCSGEDLVDSVKLATFIRRVGNGYVILEISCQVELNHSSICCL